MTLRTVLLAISDGPLLSLSTIGLLHVMLPFSFPVFRFSLIISPYRKGQYAFCPLMPLLESGTFMVLKPLALIFIVDSVVHPIYM